MSENARDIRAIAIRLPNWVGDAVMATPALRSMRQAFPSARLLVVGKPGILKILEGLPYYDDTLPIQGRGARQVLDLASRLRKARYDLGLILPNSFSSALSFFLGRVKRRTGYALNGRRLLLNRYIRPVMEGKRRRPCPMTRYYLDLARRAGGADTDEKTELRCDPALDGRADRFWADHELNGADPVIGLNPGASFGPSKLWTPEGFAGLSDRIRETLGGKTILLCGPGEEEIADAILAKARHPIIDTSRKVLPLDLLKSVMARLSALVTTDTGPRHFAVALGIPVVVIMGPTDPRYTNSNLDKTRILREEVECGPCHLKICPIDHRCMTRISDERAFASLVELLQQDPGKVKG
jgi:heptosyltransferase-2